MYIFRHVSVYLIHIVINTHFNLTGSLLIPIDSVTVGAQFSSNQNSSVKHESLNVYL